MTRAVSATGNPWPTLRGLFHSVLPVLLASAAGFALAGDDDERRMWIGNVTVTDGAVARFTVTLSRPSRRSWACPPARSPARWVRPTAP